MIPEQERLRAIAEEAEAVDCGPWHYDGRDIFTRSHVGTGDRHLLIPLPETWHASQRVPDAIARHVAAFSPLVVLDLLWLLEQAIRREPR